MTFPSPPNQPVPPAAGGGFGPPAQQGPGSFGPPAGGVYIPPPPSGGSNGPKIAAIVIGAVLVAGLGVSGLLIASGSDDGDATAGAKPHATPSAQGPDRGPGTGTGAGKPSPKPTDTLVPFVVLKPGECFDHPALDTTVTEVVTRSCGGPHDGEVIANRTLSGAFDSERALQQRALTLCEPAAKQRIRSVPEDGRQYFNYALYPSLTTYQLRDEKRISCALTLSDKPGGKKLTRPLPG